MRWFVLVSFVVALVSLAAACGGEADEPTGGFIDSKPYRGSTEAMWDFPGDGSLAALVTAGEAVVVAEVIEVVGVEYNEPSTAPVPEGMDPEFVERWRLGWLYTTYRVAVEQWLKSDGPAEILITDVGGMTVDGAIHLDGDFLLEEGRRYLMTLVLNMGAHPGEGQYSRPGGSRGTFEVTDGFVHVLNHPMAEDLEELYGGMALAEFVQVVEGFVEEGA